MPKNFTISHATEVNTCTEAVDMQVNYFREFHQVRHAKIEMPSDENKLSIKHRHFDPVFALTKNSCLEFIWTSHEYNQSL